MRGSQARLETEETRRPNGGVLRKVHALDGEKGRIAAIEPRSGNYFLGDTLPGSSDSRAARVPRSCLLHRSCWASRRLRAAWWTAPDQAVTLRGLIRDGEPLVPVRARAGALQVGAGSGDHLVIDTGFAGAVAVPESVARWTDPIRGLTLSRA